FTAAGTPVYAPLAGTVHARADNSAAQDYGPVVVLQHRTEDGHDFFTLYGHLSRESLEALEVGQPIAAGQRRGRAGAAERNGGWTPPLPFQLIPDLPAPRTNFPGVALPSQREVWLSLSPAPNPLVGIPAERSPPPEPTLAASLAARRR